MDMEGNVWGAESPPRNRQECACGLAIEEILQALARNCSKAKQSQLPLFEIKEVLRDEARLGVNDAWLRTNY